MLIVQQAEATNSEAVEASKEAPVLHVLDFPPLGQPSQPSQPDDDVSYEVSYDSLLDPNKHGLDLEKNRHLKDSKWTKKPPPAESKKPQPATSKKPVPATTKKRTKTASTGSDKKKKKKSASPDSELSQSDFLKAYLKQQETKLELWKLEMQQNMTMMQQQFQMNMQQMNMFGGMASTMMSPMASSNNVYTSLSPLKPLKLSADGARKGDDKDENDDKDEKQAAI